MCTHVKLCMNVVMDKEIKFLTISLKEKWKNAINSKDLVAKPLAVSLRVSKTIRPTVCGEDFLIIGKIVSV